MVPGSPPRGRKVWLYLLPRVNGHSHLDVSVVQITCLECLLVGAVGVVFGRLGLASPGAYPGESLCGKEIWDILVPLSGLWPLWVCIL